MSLRDTIEAARKEALEAGVLPSKTKGKQEEPSTDAAEDSAGFIKRSTARAKPSREAASGVRVVSSTGKTVKAARPEQELSREEKKARRAEKRKEEDRRITLTNIMLKQNADYKRGQRFWWIYLGAALVFTVVAFTISALYPKEVAEGSSFAGVGMLVSVVLAYAAIIFAFIYDWRKVRPIRRKIEAQVASMPSKKIVQALEAEAKRLEEKK